MDCANGLVIHFDGKTLPELTARNSTERLPIVATKFGKEQLLGVAKLEAGTGLAIANVVVNELTDWQLTKKTQAM